MVRWRPENHSEPWAPSFSNTTQPKDVTSSSLDTLRSCSAHGLTNSPFYVGHERLLKAMNFQHAILYIVHISLFSIADTKLCNWMGATLPQLDGPTQNGNWTGQLRM